MRSGRALDEEEVVTLEGRVGTAGSGRVGELFSSYIDAAGVDNTFFGSDLGQTNCPSPAQGFLLMVKLYMALGYGDEDIRKMISLNAMRLAGLGANTTPAAAH